MADSSFNQAGQAYGSTEPQPYPPVNQPYPPANQPYPPPNQPYPPAVGDPSAPYPPANPAYPQPGAVQTQPVPNEPPPKYEPPKEGYPPQGAYPPQQPAGYQQTTVYQVQPTRVISTAVRYGTNPVLMQCPYCQNTITSTTSTSPGALTWISAGVICLFGCWLGCCLIPFCIPDLQDVEHTCPSCDKYLGKCTRL